MLIWARVGDGGEYESFPELGECIEYLNSLGVGTVESWRTGGFFTPNYWGLDYVSLYWGDSSANLLRELDDEERATVECGLVDAFI